ncbi:helix-turn-helix domain-containing protein [Pectobacterium versatile]|uniref:Helix-turn-helix domain-containing protein n=1 Tax=Klebsiella huaxiensis TaxID=2153354 RepID=A0ABT6EK96_9ENTR|nr:MULTISPECIES: helix-turn-helix domain-containing protein [Enterobacterales]EKN5090153.1 helix-turn-helix domain-containing protein [Yersinia enterocolitica]EKN6368001.1 helix-turn-helix domain-containing protein [Yersinia enterocolitica]MBN3059086.1 helix-turn-helix domain-containing protein [Pectobacterium versatile]MDG1644177.1 helix-turn-helix domain-containing protein [Klebsiella huaxiensis]
MSRLPVFHEEILDEMVGWIHERPGTFMTITYLADRCGFSRWYLQRLFKRYAGLSLGYYIKAVRLERAAGELMKGERAVLDIALEFGYDTQQSFTRATTHYFGCPPGAIRQLTAAEKAALCGKFTSYRNKPTTSQGG